MIGVYAMEYEMRNKIGQKKNGKGKGCLMLIVLFVITFPLMFKVYGIIFWFVSSLGAKGTISIFLNEKIDGATWKEEVQLSDGSIILIKRHIIGQGVVHHVYEPDEIYFKKAGNYIEVLEAKGLSLPPPFVSQWDSVVIDKNAVGEWFIIVKIEDYDESSKYHSPYKQYIAVDGEWRERKFAKDFEDKKRNLEWNYKSKLHKMPELLLLSDKF